MKERIKIAGFALAFTALTMTALYIGMSRELCNRDNLTNVDYQEMKLDCSFWLYR